MKRQQHNGSSSGDSPAAGGLTISDQHFERFINAVTDYAIYMIDAGGRVNSWNSGAQRIKGYAQHEIIGRHFSVFYTEDDRVANKPQFSLDIAQQRGSFESEGFRVRKDGTRFLAQVIIEAVRDDDGQLLGYAKITRDITERRLAQQSLQQSREQTFQAQKMEALGQVTGGIAHDFNNYLMVILGNLDLARRTLQNWDDESRPRIERSIESASKGAQRAAALTRRLLAFSRREPMEVKPIDVRALMSDMTELLRSSIGETIALEMTLATRGWQIEADPVQFEAAILNLAVNARDAMPNGGAFKIVVANTLLDVEYADSHAGLAPGQYVVIELIDTGVGMSKDVMEHALEPFFTTKPSGMGTGFGLSQVYGFAKQSHGHVAIDSEVGKGTTVRLYLPRLHGAAETEALPGEEATGGGRHETILIVEDNHDVRAYLVDVLRSLGYRVLEAHDAEAAMALLASDDAHVSLLLVDVILRGKRGPQFASAARELYPGIKVLFMTGHTHSALTRRDSDQMAAILKPFTQNALAGRIRKLLDATQ